MSVSIHFLIEVKDEMGKWHLVKWYSDQYFDSNPPTPWDLQEEVEIGGKKFFENCSINPGLSLRDELGWSRSEFGRLNVLNYPNDVSEELDEKLKRLGELEKKNHIEFFGKEEPNYDYKKKYQCVYMHDLFGLCEIRRSEWEKGLLAHVKDEQLEEISKKLNILGKMVKGEKVEIPDSIEHEPSSYEDDVEYYTADLYSDVQSLYTETQNLYEKACEYVGNRWFNTDKIRLIYYFD